MGDRRQPIFLNLVTGVVSRASLKVLTLVLPLLLRTLITTGISKVHLQDGTLHSIAALGFTELTLLERVETPAMTSMHRSNCLRSCTLKTTGATPPQTWASTGKGSARTILPLLKRLSAWRKSSMF